MITTYKFRTKDGKKEILITKRKLADVGESLMFRRCYYFDLEQRQFTINNLARGCCEMIFPLGVPLVGAT